jgi:phosphate transport system substrate-binding protein
MWRWILGFTVSLLAAGCSLTDSESDLTVAGSTSVQPFADKWAEVYMEHHKGTSINIQGGGSSAGIQAVRSGAAAIGMSSRPLKTDEQDLKTIVVARDGLAIIVHPSNPLQGLALSDVKRIFAGDIPNWRALGYADREVTVVTREEGSGTRGAFQELVMGPTRIYRRAIVQDSNGTVREIVAHDPYAIGYISLGLVNEQVKALELDGIYPGEEAIEDGLYPLVRPFLFLTDGPVDGLARHFIDFVLSPEGQALIVSEGLIPAKARGS